VRNFLPVLVVVVALIVTVLVVSYQFLGGRYFWEMTDLVNQKTGEEKKEIKKKNY
jgi:uncharacterized membrane protein